MLPAECEMAIQQLDALRRGEIAADELLTLREHLDACRRCYTIQCHEDAFLERLLLVTRNTRCPEELRVTIARMIARESRDN